MTNEAILSALPDRRQRFRTFLKLFNPSSPGKNIIDQGLVCQEYGHSITRQLIARVDLGPGTQQLLVGGIGSGKTTELLLAERELASTEDMLPLYVDVTAYTDLTAVTSGSLLASLGLHVWKKIEDRPGISEQLRKAYDTVKREAYGYSQRSFVGISDRFDTLRFSRQSMQDNYRTVEIPGKLKRPLSELESGVSSLAEAVFEITSELGKDYEQLVIIFDGLDRLLKPDQFWSVAEQDLRALKLKQISVIIAGPLSVMYGPGRLLTDNFDKFYHLLPAITPRLSPFLSNILHKRQIDSFMTDPRDLERLCLASGGVLRDLISLARSAGENAYLDDSDQIESRHVDSAILQLGNNYFLGLGTEQIRILGDISRGVDIDLSMPQSLELLITRRILERPGSLYEIHPALAPLLQESLSNRA